MFDALLVTGFLILPMGLVALGTAMASARGFGGRRWDDRGARRAGAGNGDVLIAFKHILGWRSHRTLAEKIRGQDRASRSAMTSVLRGRFRPLDPQPCGSGLMGERPRVSLRRIR
jgi:hypothetical protein